MTEPTQNFDDELAEDNAQVADEDEGDPRELTGAPAAAPTETGRPPEVDESDL